MVYRRGVGPSIDVLGNEGAVQLHQRMIAMKRIVFSGDRRLSQVIQVPELTPRGSCQARREKSFMRFTCGFLDIDPVAALGTVQNSVANSLRFQSIPESWMRRFTGFQALQEVGNLMNERVLITICKPGTHQLPI